MEKIILEIDTGDEQDNIAIQNMFAVQTSLMEDVLFRKEGSPRVCKVKGCYEAEFEGIDCLEMENKVGFFKSENDIRPSQCTWIDKEKAEHLYKLFTKKKYEFK